MALHLSGRVGIEGTLDKRRQLLGIRTDVGRVPGAKRLRQQPLEWLVSLPVLVHHCSCPVRLCYELERPQSPALHPSAIVGGQEG
jgi:hypothetical protein